MRHIPGSQGVHVQFDTLHTYIKPRVEISKEAQKINNIKLDDLRDAPRIEEKLNDILETIGDRNIVAWNAEFDNKFLTKGFCGSNLSLNNHWIDLMEVAKNKLPHLDSYSLINVAKYFGLDTKGAHSADKDVKLLINIYCYLYPEVTKHESKDSSFDTFFVIMIILLIFMLYIATG
jgi:DNA polymerase III alpha subunit (gram-positive type)